MNDNAEQNTIKQAVFDLEQSQKDAKEWKTAYKQANRELFVARDVLDRYRRKFDRSQSELYSAKKLLSAGSGRANAG